MLRSFPTAVPVALLALLLLDDASARADQPVSTYVYDVASPGWAYCCDPNEESSWVRIEGRGLGLPAPPPDELGRPVYLLAPDADGSAYRGDASVTANWIQVLGWEQGTDRTFVYDLTNPGWAYCCNADLPPSWIRIDGSAVGLPAPPPDPLDSSVYVLDLQNPGAAFTGNPGVKANWIRIVGWEGALLTPTPRPTTVPSPSSVSVPSVPTAQPLPPLGPTVVPGTYTQRWSDSTVVHASVSSPLTYRDGVFHNLAFNGDLAGKKLTAAVETFSGGFEGYSRGGTYLFRSFVGPIKPGYYYYPSTWPGPCERPTAPSQTICLVSTDVTRWTISEGQYFVIFDGRKTVNGTPAGGYDSITYSIRIE